MKPGSKVITIGCFKEVSKHWPNIPYPNTGDILTITGIEKHHKFTFYLLTFEELITVPLCDYNFRELEENELVEELVNTDYNNERTNSKC